MRLINKVIGSFWKTRSNSTITEDKRKTGGKWKYTITTRYLRHCIVESTVGNQDLKDKNPRAHHPLKRIERKLF